MSIKIPPFNTQPNVQAISSDISAFLLEWSENALRPGLVARHTFPAERVDAAVDQYIAELDSGRDETRGRYERVKKLIRQRW
jgi:nuclear pore complex protein Nup155